MKVSYCITCKNRLSHIQATLPRNLASMADDENVEFVLLNYQSEDGLAEWVEATFAAEIASGRLVHAYHFPAPHFRMTHAKNMAHRLASGDILCNLDADNILPKGYSEWLRKRFAENPDRTISARGFSAFSFLNERIVKRVLGLPRPPGGLFGRIAVTRGNFYKLGGYDETLSAWGFDDADFQLRGRDSGIKPYQMPQDQWGGVIEHGTEERVSNLSKRDREVSAARLDRKIWTQGWEWAQKVWSRHDPYPNVTGQIGCGTVKINFADTVTTLEPIERP